MLNPVITCFDDAVEAAYRATRDEFVAERKRAVTQLRTRGDKEGAARAAALARPTLPAWAVNQLHWHARESLDELFRTAERLRAGELDASTQHRAALARLRDAAAERLRQAGSAATEATLRRVTTTLTALAAAGGFAPDLPGALTREREAPGFDGLSLGAAPATVPASSAHPAPAPADAAPRGRRAAEERRLAEQQRAAEERRLAEQQRAAEERRLAEQREALERKRERQRLELRQRLEEARAEAEARSARIEHLAAELATAERELSTVQTRVSELTASLAELEVPPE